MLSNWSLPRKPSSRPSTPTSVSAARSLCLPWDGVGDDPADPQPVVLKNRAAAPFLGLTMPPMGPPPDQGRFVAPERQGQDPPGATAGGEAFDAQEAVDLLEIRPQQPGESEIVVVSLGLRV